MRSLRTALRPFLKTNFGLPARATRIAHLNGLHFFRNKIQKQRLFTTSESKSAKNELPVLAALRKKVLPNEKTPKLFGDDTMLLCIHHALESATNLFEEFKNLGIKPKNMLVVDKHYSRSNKVVEEIKEMGVYYQIPEPQFEYGNFTKNFISDIFALGREAVRLLKEDNNIKNIVILDHGGHATNLIADRFIYDENGNPTGKNVIIVSKTTADLIKIKESCYTPPCQIINVARCAVKKFIEAPLIAEAIVGKLKSIMAEIKQESVCVIVGYGIIGEALAKHLRELSEHKKLNLKIVIHDTDPNQLAKAKEAGFELRSSNLEAATVSVDFLFCCALKDISKELMETFKFINKKVKLISCTSEDTSYLTLLKQIQKEIRKKNNKYYTVNPVETISFINEMGYGIDIEKGGFPANFDDSGVSVPNEDIQLTRALVLGAVLQAAESFKRKDKTSGIVALDPGIQQFIVNEFMKNQPANRFPEHTRFKDISWIVENSEGRGLEYLSIFDNLQFSESPQNEINSNKLGQ